MLSVSKRKAVFPVDHIPQTRQVTKEFGVKNREETLVKKHSVVVRNERLTALAGALLFVLIIAELVVTANLNQLISIHIFVGTLLAGPLVVKMSSVGYRFLSYYRRVPDFVHKGPPNIWLRMSAPFLVVLTLVVFISGFGLVYVGPSHAGLFKIIHAASVVLWLPLTAIHVYGNFRKVPRSIAGDWGRKITHRVSGRSTRLGINVIGLILGAVAAVMIYPSSAPWSHYRINHGLPGVLILGIIAAVFAFLIAIPLFRNTNRG